MVMIISEGLYACWSSEVGIAREWREEKPLLTVLFTTLLTVELYFSNVLHGNYVCTW